MSLPIAYNLLRNGPHYRRECFTVGLQNAGYKVRNSVTHHPNPEDILLIWNRYGDYERRAANFERFGAAVIIAENGYGHKGDEKFFALSLNQHHHGGIDFSGKVESIEPKEGKHILICAQRGIGSEKMKSPHGWHNSMKGRLEKLTRKPIKIRLHPGKYSPPVPLEKDLKNCHACVIWSSACGITALENRVQVFYDAPRWIAELSAKPISQILSGELDINHVYNYSTAGLLTAYSNQYSLEEIRSGVPFKQLKGIHDYKRANST